MRELLTPFDRVTSPWLEMQGIVPQFDDGVVVARGAIDGKSTVVAAIEGGFQGGSLGEVGGAKIAGLLELAVDENKKGNPTAAVLILESGGVRLQEANLGLGAIAEIQAAIVELRQYQPVVGIVPGPVGCFGGMSITAGLCSYLIMTREGRLGLNGPQVIEQEAGVEEYDSRDRRLIWGITGGIQRHRTEMVDVFVDDDFDAMSEALQSCFAKGIPAQYRSDEIKVSLEKLLNVDNVEQMTADAAYQVLIRGVKNDE